MYKPDLKRFETLWTAAQDVWIKLFSANFITAAAINGHAPGGGYMLSACCEYRDMVSGKSTIGMLETSIGFIPPTWIINIMLYTIPKRHAEFALTSSRLFTVDEALKVGLIDETATDKVDAIEKCKQFIKKFDRIPPLARTITKQKIRDGPLKWMTENRSNDIQEFFTLINKPKVQEAIEVYIQKLKQKAAK